MEVALRRTLRQCAAPTGTRRVGRAPPWRTGRLARGQDPPARGSQAGVGDAPLPQAGPGLSAGGRGA